MKKPLLLTVALFTLILNAWSQQPYNDACGNVLVFDGTNDYVDLGPDLGNFGTNDFSVSVWFKANPSSATQTIIGKRSAPSNGNFWTITITPTGKIVTELDEGGNPRYNPIISASANTYNDRNWHHVVLTRADKTATLYLDGVLEGQKSTSALTNLAPPANATIGARFVNSTANNFFSGQIDEVAFYNTELSLAEVGILYSTGTSSGSSLTNYYGFNIGRADTIVYDLAGSYNGTLVNMNTSAAWRKPDGSDAGVNRSSVTIEACDSYTSPSTKYTWTASGTYTDTLTNQYGCDSIMSVNLTIKNSTAANFAQEACESYEWQGTTYTASGTYTATIPNSVGCDSVMTLDLTIKNRTTATFTQTACDIYEWQGISYTNSGTFVKTITNSAGCDSVITLNLTIKKSTAANFTQTACDSYEWFGTTYTTSGNYAKVIPNSVGCDSVMTLDLTIGSTYIVDVDKTVCGSFEWAGNNYTTSGTYSNLFTSSTGCDSTVNLNLTVNQPSSSSVSVTQCDNYEWFGVNYTESGTYNTVIPNSVGCDSVITLNLNLNKSTIASFTETACDSYEWQGSTYSVSGIYNATIPNSVGCDSLMTLNLTINNSTSADFTQTACNEYAWQGSVYTESGSYTTTIPNSVGCDSVMTLNLTINRSTLASFTEYACDSFEWLGQTYTESGNYSAVIPNSVGCDSTMTLNLTVEKINNEVVLDGFYFIAQQEGATYQWLNCDSNNEPVEGATEKKFMPLVPGNYAVEITTENCSKLSECYNIIVTGLEDDLFKKDLKVYPNPSSTGEFKLELGSTYKNTRLTIVNSLGKTLATYSYQHLSRIPISLEQGQGIYFLRIEADNKSATLPLVISR
jgi:hypothetical protein